jgi:hypothetical protein
MNRDAEGFPPPAFPYAAAPGSLSVPLGSRFPRCRDCRSCRSNAGDDATAWFDCRKAEELAGTPAGEINSFSRACWHYGPIGSDRPVTLLDLVGLAVAVLAAAAAIVTAGPLVAIAAVVVLP